MRLILNGDDLGYSPAVNQAIFALHERGRLSSASLLVNLPHSEAAIRLALERPNLAVGVHLNLTRDRPCSPPEQIPTLVGKGGLFYPSPAFFPRAATGRISMGQVEIELRAQIELTRAAGLRITHLDSHSHWHILSPFRCLLQRLAREYGVPRIRTSSLRSTLLPNPIWLAVLTLAPASQPTYFLSLHHWLNGPGEFSPLLNGRRVRRLLGRPEVTTEVVLHPGRAQDPDFPPDTLPAERRQWEYDLVQSALFDRWLEAVGAQVVPIS